MHRTNHRKYILRTARTAFVAALAVLAIATSSGAAVDLPEEAITADMIDKNAETRELSPGAVSVVRADKFEGEMKDLPDLLERVPGLHVIRTRGRGGYTVASIRGSTSSQVAVYVDGVLMNLGSEAAVDLSAIPVENVERVEVYRGYIPARFGSSSMGGVVNIVTKQADEPASSITLGVGSYGLLKTAASYSDVWGSGRYLIAVNHESSDGDFKYDNDNGTPFNQNDDYRAKRRNMDYSNSDVLFKWQDEHWRAKIAWVKNDRSLPYGAAGADKPHSPPGAALDMEKIDVSIGRRQMFGSVEWNWRLEYLHQDKEFDDPSDTTGGWGERHNRYKTARYAVAAGLSAPLWDNHFFELYATYYDETLKPEGDIVSVLGGRSKISERHYELSAQDSVALTRDGSLLLIPGIRWNKDDVDSDFTWQLALNKSWNNGLYVKGTYGTYSRSPNLYERYGDGASIRPNRDLKWESGTQWDIGTGWSGNAGDIHLAVDASYFVRDTDDLIEYVMTSPRYGIYQNVGKARAKGVEIEFSADWGNGWNLFGSATWMDAYDRTDGSYRQNSPLPNRPEWAAVLRMSKKWNPNFSNFAEVQYIGENYYDLSGSVMMDDLTLVSLGASYRFDNGVRLSVGVDDLFDESPDARLTAGGMSRMLWFPLQGRRFYANVSWVF